MRQDYDTLLGGDFNCVENVETDTRKQEGQERRIRKRPRPQILRSTMNEIGLIDAYNLVNGSKIGNRGLHTTFGNCTHADG
eukprot:scaffold286975_cov39-Tisochrysis_lutea.AAC.1